MSLKGSLNVFVIITGILISVMSLPIAAATRCVSPGGTGGCSSSIQQAIDAAAPGDTIVIGRGIYTENLVVTKPLTLLRNLDNRDLLAHIEAVDDYMAHMLAYPGRTFAQLYHRFFRINDLADGRVELSDRTIDIADVDVPALVVAGTNDVLAPAEAVLAVEELLTGTPVVRVERAPGGHLGVLTGRGARLATWRYLDEFLAANDVEQAAVRQAAAEASGHEAPAAVA